jgi:hypothetical protein
MISIRVVEDQDLLFLAPVPRMSIVSREAFVKRIEKGTGVVFRHGHFHLAMGASGKMASGQAGRSYYAEPLVMSE